MSVALLENRLRGLRLVLAGLEALAEDICRDCRALEVAKTKITKMVKKLGMDLETARGAKASLKRELRTRQEALFRRAEELKVAAEVT